MKSILTSLMITMCMVFAHPVLADDTAPGIYVVEFHADWCGSCKVLGPEIDKARGKAGLDDSLALFVTLDLTDATKRHQSALLANALGLGEFFQQNAGKTGFAVLVDAKTGEVKGKLTKDMNANAIIESIQSFI